ncbi:GNAT family N-acetyltransferase [Pusillimonas sp. MFBS29]|uniref:GNAT family N-acetyltransferase n=1 Tax=Pusillimonas sp. MFBS29 TaxID=2886690 RepID=UPI001D129163|nr:GNAT family N-acetyltransferase [Pusillimonas sp. MFBS29]MCC2596455.1 GNAT family N-acetyltransferase [Pusillimonas sp. MFBS29]
MHYTPHDINQTSQTVLPVTFKLAQHIEDINPDDWNQLVAGRQPFVQHAFLLALDKTGCARPDTGWAPQYLLMFRDDVLAGAMPLYLKYHSRGEYVFDQAWAHAFERNGLPYYPKLLAAIPFTPVTGPRLLAASHEDKVLLARQAIDLCRQNKLSSLHILFPSEAEHAALAEAGFLFRYSVQFHWTNQNYADINAFLHSLNQQKRKKLKQDKKKVAQAGVGFRWLEGSQITEEILAFFYRCYAQTYLEHGQTPYLNLAFFQALYACNSECMVIVLAEQDGQPIAAALNIRDEQTLYGRYWGSLRFVSGLHFETCYMQGIEFCIARNLSVFEGGAQGEHKLSRGMLPTRTCSAHWIADDRYARAIDDYLGHETPAVDAYLDELAAHSPFRQHPLDLK